MHEITEYKKHTDERDTRCRTWKMKEHQARAEQHDGPGSFKMSRQIRGLSGTAKGKRMIGCVGSRIW